MNTWNQINKAHRGSWKLKKESQSLHGFVLGHLHVFYGCIAWCYYRTPNHGSRESTHHPAFLTVYTAFHLVTCELVCYQWLSVFIIAQVQGTLNNSDNNITTMLITIQKWQGRAENASKWKA